MTGNLFCQPDNRFVLSLQFFPDSFSDMHGFRIMLLKRFPGCQPFFFLFYHLYKKGVGICPAYPKTQALALPLRKDKQRQPTPV